MSNRRKPRALHAKMCGLVNPDREALMMWAERVATHDDDLPNVTLVTLTHAVDHITEACGGPPRGWSLGAAVLRMLQADIAWEAAAADYAECLTALEARHGR